MNSFSVSPTGTPPPQSRSQHTQARRPSLTEPAWETGNNGVIVTHDYIHLQGLEIRNWSDNAIWTEGAGFLEVGDCLVHDVGCGVGLSDGTHDFLIQSVEAHHFDLYGFDASTGGGAPCHNGSFEDCVAHTARDPEQNVDGFALGHGSQHDFALTRCETYDVYDGFDVSAASTTLDRCSAHGCWNGGYKLWQDDLLLTNCLGYGNSVTAVELDWDGDPGTSTLWNCTFLGTGTFGVWVENASDTLHLHNCIVAGGDGIALAFEQHSVSNYWGDHNVFHNDNPNRLIVVGYEDEFAETSVTGGQWTAYSGQDANSLEATPGDLFLDAIAPDLQLRAGSPAIDAGATEGAPGHDYAGSIRPQGQGVDIGAYERNPSQKSPVMSYKRALLRTGLLP